MKLRLRKKGALWLPVIIALGVSCSRRQAQTSGPEDAAGRRMVAVEFHTLPFEGTAENDASLTKSRFEECQDKISGINLLVFEEEGGSIVAESSGYFSLEALRCITLPSDGVFNVYFFANVPDLTASFPDNESGIGTFGYQLGSYDELLTLGFPMSYSQKVDTSCGEIINVWFRRLVTRLELSFDKSALSRLHRQGTYIKSMRICSAALDIFPFMEGGSKSVRTTGGGEEADKALEADVNILNDGGCVYLYTLTNMQGTLLPSDTPQNGKTPQALASSQSAEQIGRLTYIEAHCALDCDDWSTDDAVLRHYIGGDGQENYNCSFDVWPGKSRQISLVLTEDDPLLQAWRFDAEGNVSGKRFEISLPQVLVMKNFPSTFTVRAPFDFDILSTGEDFSADITESVFDEEDETWTKTVCVETDKALTGLLETGKKASCITEQLVFGGLTRSCRDTSVTVKIYHQVFPLTLQVDCTDSLRIFGENPLELPFRCDFDLTDTEGNIIQSVSGIACTPSPKGEEAQGYGNAVRKIQSGGTSPTILSVLLQPQWKGNSGFWMGSGNAALFGPGKKFSPGRLDATKKILYSPPYNTSNPSVLDFYSNVEFHLDLSYTTAGDLAAPGIFFLPSTDQGDASLKTTDGFSYGKADSRFAVGSFTPESSTGHNNSADFCLDDFEACPFYIANGCMQCTHINLCAYSWNATNKMEEVRLKFLSPGRDLCEVPSNYGQTSQESDLLFRISGKLNNYFDTDQWVEAASYDFSGIHLIVNSCTCWPGGSATQQGVTAP